MIATARQAQSESGASLDPALVSEFYLWLWWWTETSGHAIDLGALGSIDAWVDDRVSLSDVRDAKNKTVLAGDRAPGTPEGHAAIEGGKMPEELRIVIRRDGQEYGVTMKGAHMDLSGLRLPGSAESMEEEQVQERLLLAEQITDLLAAIFRRFALVRVSPTGALETVPALRAWIASRPGGRE